MNRDAAEEPLSGSTGAPAPDPPPNASGSPEAEEADDAAPAEPAEPPEGGEPAEAGEPQIPDATIDAEWHGPPAVLPEPDPTVSAVPVVVPAVASHRAAASARLNAVVRPRRSAEGGGPLNRLRPRNRRPDGPRRPWLVLPAVVALALVAVFFAWVSAEPFWLAVGHGDTGTATVINIRHGRLDERCLSNFAAADGRFRAHAVPVTGVARSHCAVGSTLDARMVSREGREAYAGGASGLTARWMLGLLLVLGCALLIVRVSGAARFTGRERLAAVTMTFCAPLAIAVGVFAAAF